MNAYGEQMLLHASVPPHSARLVCNQLTALTWKHVSVWRHTQTRHHQNNLPLFFPPLRVSLSALWKLNLPSRQQSIWGRPLPKWAKGALLSLVFSSLTLLIATYLWQFCVCLRARATCSPIREAPVGARGPFSASVTRLGPFLLC